MANLFLKQYNDRPSTYTKETAINEYNKIKILTNYASITC